MPFTVKFLMSNSPDPDTLLALSQLEESHHLTIPATENEDELHIYSMVGHATYGDDKKNTIRIAIPLGPVLLTVTTKLLISWCFLTCFNSFRDILTSSVSMLTSESPSSCLLGKFSRLSK
jgi:hypothetical protein